MQNNLEHGQLVQLSIIFKSSFFKSVAFFVHDSWLSSYWMDKMETIEIMKQKVNRRYQNFLFSYFHLISSVALCKPRFFLGHDKIINLWNVFGHLFRPICLHFCFRHRWITDTFFEDSGDSGKSRASSTTLADSSPRESTPSPTSDWQMRPPAKRKMSTGSDSNSAGGQSGAPDVIYADIDADSQAPTQVYSFWLLYRGDPFPL